MKSVTLKTYQRKSKPFHISLFLFMKCDGNEIQVEKLSRLINSFKNFLCYLFFR
jgi:hypothetical protein